MSGHELKSLALKDKDVTGAFLCLFKLSGKEDIKFQSEQVFLFLSNSQMIWKKPLMIFSHSDPLNTSLCFCFCRCQRNLHCEDQSCMLFAVSCCKYRTLLLSAFIDQCADLCNKIQFIFLLILHIL